MRDLIGTIYPHGTYTDNSKFSLAVAEFVLSKDILKYPKLYSTWTAPKSCTPPKCSYLNILWLLFGKNYRFFSQSGKKSNNLSINVKKTSKNPWRSLCMLSKT
jgi:hypothetical protein